MTAPLDLDRLVSLVDDAKAAASKLGPGLDRVADLLARALDDLHAIQAHGGRPDEGLRPDQLTSDNDR